MRALTAEVTGTLAPFDGWLCWQAQRYFAEMAGLAWNLENTDLTLNYALWGHDPYWACEEGRSILEFMREIGVYDYHSRLWIGEDGELHSGCPYCGYARNGTEGDDHHAVNHISGGWNSAGCFVYDQVRTGNAYGVDRWLALGSRYVAEFPVAETDPMRSSVMAWSLEDIAIEAEYYNQIKVKGAKRMERDDPISVEWTDWKSVQNDTDHPMALGRKKTLGLTYEWANNYTILNRIAQPLYARHTSPPVYLSLTIPFSPDIRIGHVVGVYGFEISYIKLNENRWRVVDYAHQSSASNAPIATTLKVRLTSAMPEAP